MLEQGHQWCLIRRDVGQLITEIIQLLQSFFIREFTLIGDVIRCAGEMVDGGDWLAQPLGHQDGCDREVLVMIYRHAITTDPRDEA
jgi:hypothetical protein